MFSDPLWLIPLFFLIALFYSAAGFGGGSSYLAVLSLFAIDFVSMRMIALLCNIVVVGSSTFLFAKDGYLKIKKILPLVILSIPFAYLGGTILLEANLFFKLLGSTLLVSSILMLLSQDITKRMLPKYANAGIGGGIGFLSGMVGIGGGIFLSPFLHLSKWDTPKYIAATTAAFILVNSIAGLVGQISVNQITTNPTLIIGLLLAVLIGGQIGCRITISKLSPLVVRRITAILILIVAMRLLLVAFGVLS